ncbi:MAG: 2,3-diphosphoglycerate-dependent phosphoglycerate mutase [Bacteroidales bacterium]|nr:2,3-diphosphoglycerate-dependent phosphoglycerate mutase [Bacteroidales bacterium]
MNKKLILVRHGQSEWNKLNLFTGWKDVDLSEQGKQEAFEAGKAMIQYGVKPQICFTSYLKRAIKTLNIALDAMDLDYLPVYKSWRLNEKHYGQLQGLNKKETAEKYGEEQVLKWRRVFDCQPPALEENDERSPLVDERYKDVDKKDLPLTESLKDCIARCMPYFNQTVLPAFKNHDTVLIAAHGNSLRGIVMNLKKMSEEEIIKFNIPTGIPYVFTFDENMNLIKDEFLADEQTVKKLMDAVANQGKK